MVLGIPLLVACSLDGPSTVRPTEPSTVIVPATATSPPALLATLPATAEPTEGTDTSHVMDPLGVEELVRYQPNELGRIPILMYHGFVYDEAYLDEWTVTPDIFRGQLQWLSDNNFYVVPLIDLITNEIKAPPGKHPVVLTFDDASSRQFRLIHDETGVLVPDPNTAVGIMESMFEANPDFGRGGLFAILPTNCFRYAEEVVTCEDRLAWLADHGYEIANHTWSHENLHTVSDEVFKEQIGQTKIWIDERVTGRANLSNVLVLPFGEWPRSEHQIQMLRDGFVYGGQHIVVAGIVEVTGGPSPSPSSGTWSRRSISRINTDPETWAYWTDRITSGVVTLYTSDGNPATVTIPTTLPSDLVEHWDADWASAYNMQVIRYDLP